LPCPNAPFLPTAGEKPVVSVLIVPDESKSGCLEDLLWDAVKTDSWSRCMKQFLQCLKKCQQIELPSNLAKVWLHAFLAVQKEPGKPIGQATKAKYFPLDAPVFARLRQFLEQLAS